MTLKQFIVTMIIATLFVWLGWVFVILEIDPLISGWTGFLFFYTTLGTALIGTLSIIGMAVRRALKPSDLVSRQVLTSFRQALWFSAIIILTLFLLSKDFFHLWIITLIITIFTFLELAFLSAKRRPVSF